MERLGDTVLEFNNHSLHDDAIIVAKNLQFTYAQNQQLSCQLSDCHIAKGQFIVLCGKSGSGKSTFLKMLNGLIPDYYAGTLTGSLRVADYHVGRESVEVFSNQVSSVFQNPKSQFFYREVKHELVFPCENQGIQASVILDRLHHLAADFQFETLLDSDMYLLSGGQKQRVAIATALMQGTPIMVFDEPTAHLDNKGIAMVKSYLKQLKDAGKTIIIAEHRLHYLVDLADQFFYFNQGNLDRVYSPEEIRSLPQEEREAYGLRSLDISPLFEELEAMVAPKEHVKTGLYLKHLTIKASAKKLLYLPEMHFDKGSITGILGSNGIGKSQLATYLTGLLEDKASEIRFEGKLLSAKERLEKTSLVMQDVSLQLFAESVSKEITLGQRKAVDADQVLDALALKDLMTRHPASLSGGEQQRVMIAASLLSEKDIFIFDEPSSGLDFVQMKALAALLKKLRAQGKVVILISHDEELLANTCDHLYQLEDYKFC
ncbi:ATP-binding cassette domain-containing protein [Streptococcus iniae]